MIPDVAVTGAGGFIGATIVEELRRAGASVRPVYGPDDVPAPGSGSGDVQCDITDVAALRTAFAGAKVVVHAAGPPSVYASFRDPVEHVRVHVLGTACLIEAMRHAGVSSIVYLSSAEVYGRPMDRAVDERHPLEPRSPYGAAKVGAEALLRAASASFELQGYILRPFSVYGARMAAGSVLGTIVAQAREGNVVRLADLAPVRDYCYVRDVAVAVVAACGAPSSGMAVMNVATGIPTSVRDLVDAVGEALSRRFDVRTRDEGKRPPKAEIGRLVGNVDAIRGTLRWQPRYDLRQGLRETFAALGLS